MNRRLVLLAALSALAFVPVAEARRPVPMVEVIDAPFAWPGGNEGSLERAERAVFAGLAGKGWIGTRVGPGHAHGVLSRPDYRAEIDVTFNTKSFSIRYADSDRLDYDATRHLIHPNFNRWLAYLQQLINVQLANPVG